MSPLISLLEKEKKPILDKHEHQDIQKAVSGSECGCGSCLCLQPCANCTCRDKKER